jgi:hypothetical protein
MTASSTSTSSSPSRSCPRSTFDANIAITTSGVFSHAALIAAVQAVGIDNMMFSIDYPFEPTGKAVEFMRTAPLALADKEKVGTGTPNVSCGSSRSPAPVRFIRADRALLAALLNRLPRDVLKRLHLVVRPYRAPLTDGPRLTGCGKAAMLLFAISGYVCLTWCGCGERR